MEESVKPDPLQMSANGTHQPVLFGLVAQTTGPVIELGVGHYSTSQLHFMCRNRFLLSVEKDHDWHQFHAIPFRNGCHEFLKIPDNETYLWTFEQERFKDMFWDVAFVDHAPAAERKQTVEALRKRAKFIVVHDAEPEAGAYNWGTIFDTFKYRYYWNFYKNGTMAVSDFEPINLPKVRY